MSTTATRLPLADAIREAEAFRALFAGTYERWEVAGSVRRKCADVGDVEHVAIAHNDANLFVGGCPTNIVRDRAGRRINEGVVTKHRYGASQTPRFGDRYIGLDFNGRNHEIFMCSPDNWGCILAIRTGPAEFSRELVTRLRPRGYVQKDGFLQTLTPGTQHLTPIPCPDEETIFRAAGLEFIPPERR